MTAGKEKTLRVQKICMDFISSVFRPWLTTDYFFPVGFRAIEKQELIPVNNNAMKILIRLAGIFARRRSGEKENGKPGNPV